MDDAWRLPEDTELITRHAAVFLGVHPVTLRRWKCQGRTDRPMPTGTRGRSLTYRLGDLERYKNRKTKPTPSRLARIEDTLARIEAKIDNRGD